MGLLHFDLARRGRHACRPYNGNSEQLDLAWSGRIAIRPYIRNRNIKVVLGSTTFLLCSVSGSFFVADVARDVQDFGLNWQLL